MLGTRMNNLKAGKVERPGERAEEQRPGPGRFEEIHVEIGASDLDGHAWESAAGAEVKEAEIGEGGEQGKCGEGIQGVAEEETREVGRGDKVKAGEVSGAK